MSIPVVDFSVASLNVEDISDVELQELSRELKEAFMEVGFVFLKNFGITQAEVDRVMDASRNFFLQPDHLKMPFRKFSFPISPHHGWLSMESERLNRERPEDLKESFNVTSLHPDIKWPSSEAAPGFQETQISFFHRCKELSLRIMRVMAHSLDLDPDIFLNAHRLIGTEGNCTTLRSLYYPPVNSEQAKEGQLRCGEHSDYGTITLVFQNAEGLQVRRRSGEFVSAPCVPGAVLVNIADLMQRWTSDHFVSVLHRVLLPPAGDCSSTRQSVAFFVQPDDEAVVTCIDGSDKYPPVRSGAYLMERLNYSYGRA
ncbi:2-oxoglutarate-dependent dioxygenase htyE [Syngnathus acus]|uniref:2-oxoglutarate-dependent dioxygenase htyE n=1 Tax=Syngnathus acus TaxID=161584 RepID=UPI001885F0F9|nr:2-oxoglutarate-dependent dioxygenase htyE [Syngnathus acus]